MKRIVYWVFFGVTVVMGITGTAFGAELSFHGDMNHRFLLYTNHNDFMRWDQKGVLHEGGVEDNFAEIKYRFWFDAATNDGDVRGVYAFEVGGLRFGESGKMDYSGDDITLETRWAYLDFQLPGVESDARLKIGLQPINVNPYVWKETVGGVQFDGGGDTAAYRLAWFRGWEVDKKKSDDEDDRTDVDAFHGRLNFKPSDGLEFGLFGLYQISDADKDDPEAFDTLSSVDYEIKYMKNEDGSVGDLNLGTLGIDGGFKRDGFFAAWDLMYQLGSIDNLSFVDYASGQGNSGDFDVSAYFGHLDLGLNMGITKLTYTFWYTSGDDDPTDTDFNAFIATDIDIADSIIIQEGSLADDDGFTERHYILDKGFIMNKLRADFQVTEDASLGAHVLYMLTAEDIEYTAAANGRTYAQNDLGIEVGAFFKYKLYKGLTWEMNAAYLASGDAMDFFEEDVIQDGSADENPFLTSMRIRYKF